MYIYSSPWALALETIAATDDRAERQKYYTVYLLSQIFWALAVTLIRSSIILLYIRIFPPRSFRLTCYAVLMLNAAFSVGAVITDCLMCLPVACKWARLYTDSDCKCGVQILLNNFSVVTSLLLDITVVVLPMPLLWGLQMAVSKKVVLSGMFGLGTV